MSRSGPHGMDVAREGVAGFRRRRRVLVAAAGGTALLLVFVLLLRLDRAAPVVDRDAVFLDTVRRGEMIRIVRAPGTLVPVESRWVSAQTRGEVIRTLLVPGARVEPDSVILVLEESSVEQLHTDNELIVASMEADLDDLRVRTRRDLLRERSRLAALQSEARQAKLDAEAAAEILREGIIGRIEFETSRVAAEALQDRARLAEERLRLAEAQAEARIDAQQARIDQVRSTLSGSVAMLDALTVRAGVAGVLQEVAVEVGEWVEPGARLARVAEPSRLKAELRVAEVRAGDVEVGQTVRIDARNVVLAGRVSRVDPAVREGTVVVDAELLAESPAGVRADLTVDGLIEVERIPDVLHMDRPALGGEGGSVSLFRLEADGKTAVRTPVLLGRTSVGAVEVVSGLREGDTVILTGMSAWNGHDRIRLR